MSNYQPTPGNGYIVEWFDQFHNQWIAFADYASLEAASVRANVRADMKGYPVRVVDLNGRVLHESNEQGKLF